MITEQWTHKLRALRVMPVIEIDNANDAEPLARILIENGLPAAEITFRTKAAPEAIARIRQAFPDIILCAGTVLTQQQAKLAIESGADFVVSPGFNPSTVTFCLENEIKIIPGINSPSLVEQAMAMGVNMLKFFPAEASGGLAMLKALTGPYRQIQLMPTGGVNVTNLRDYLAISQVVACGGTWIAPTAMINNHDWDAIAKNVRETRKLIESA